MTTPGLHIPRAAAPTDPTVAEGQAISRASRQQVSSLSSQAAAAALEEVAERITPATLAFLKARGAKKMLAERSGQAEDSVPAPAVGRGPAAPAPPPMPATAPATAAIAAARSTSAPTAPSGFSFEKAGSQPSAGSKHQSGAGSALSAAASTSDIALQAASRAKASTTAAASAAAVAAAVGGGKADGSSANGQLSQDVSEGAEPPGTVADPRPVARLRWSLHGEVVGLQREDERVVDEEVGVIQEKRPETLLTNTPGMA